MVKIRHIGILSSRTKQKDLAIIRKSLNVPPPPPKVKMTTRELIKLTTAKAQIYVPAVKKVKWSSYPSCLLSVIRLLKRRLNLHLKAEKYNYRRIKSSSHQRGLYSYVNTPSFIIFMISNE